MTQLNADQKAAAEFINGIASVVAVPGSGKTLTMTHRIGNLVKQGVSPESILGLTFTRNAAQAMRDKLETVLEDTASRVHLSTIHSFCLSLLKNEGRSFEILHGKEQIIIIRKIMRKMKINNLPTGMILREISLAKSNLIPLEDFKALYEGDATMLKVAEVFQDYEQEKRKRLLLDFDDLLVETCQLLKKKPKVRKKYQGTWNHILVDEFQDTNPAQMEILQLLVGDPNGKKSSFWICGDDWQAIYSFAGASVGNILTFKDQFPESSQFILKLNYRSTPQILKACMNLIKRNVKKIEKTLNTENPQGEEPVVLDAANEEEEATVIANEIMDLVTKKRFRHKEIGILYRANFQSRAIEDAFAQQKIPYHIENGMNFYQRREVKILLDYLAVINNPSSQEGDEALKSIMNIPNRYIGRKFISEVEDFSIRKDIHLWDGLKSMPIEIPYLKQNVRVFTGLLKPLIKDSPKMNPAEVIHILRESLNYDAYITEDDVPSPDDSKIANINELQMVANKFDDIKSLLKYAETFNEELSNDENGVSLMSIHKSKGLEFPAVFLIGMVEGILPNKQADIEEERRVCFVGMSRAMKLLYLTFSHASAGKKAKRSSFLDEIMDHQDLS